MGGNETKEHEHEPEHLILLRCDGLRPLTKGGSALWQHAFGEMSPATRALQS